jgi:hypothetical protein
VSTFGFRVFGLWFKGLILNTRAFIIEGMKAEATKWPNSLTPKDIQRMMQLHPKTASKHCLCVCFELVAVVQYQYFSCPFAASAGGCAPAWFCRLY